MIKIERLLNGGQATIVRHGYRMPVYQNMAITVEELASLTLTRGSVTYSIDEEEVITREYDSKLDINTAQTVVPSNRKIVFPDKLKKLIEKDD